jgi:hypothetical protein
MLATLNRNRYERDGSSLSAFVRGRFLETPVSELSSASKPVVFSLLAREWNEYFQQERIYRYYSI